MRRLALLVVAGVAASGCATGLVAAGPGAAARNAALPGGGKVVARMGISPGSGGFAVGVGAVWAMSDAGPTLTRIDPARNGVVARIKLVPRNQCPAVPPGCGEVAAGNAAVWVSHSMDDTVSRIDPVTNRVVATIEVGSHPDGIAVSPGAVWVANSGDPSVSRIDPTTNRVVAKIRVGPASACCSDSMQLTAGVGGVWVAVPTLNAVARLDPATNTVTARIRLSARPDGFLAADKSAVWVAAAHSAPVVWRIDPKSNKPIEAVKRLAVPIGLALGFGSLWVAELDSKMIERVNARTARIVGRLRVGGYPAHLGVGFGSVWVRDDTGRVLRIQPQE